MKAFQFNQKMCASIGLNRPQPFEKFHWFNLNNSIILIVFGLTIISAGLTIFKSKTFVEISVAATFTTSFIVIFSMLVVLIWKTPIIYELIDIYGFFIARRMTIPTSKKIYDDANKNIEKLSEILEIVSVKISTCGVIFPFLMMTTYSYLTKGLEDEDYILPLPLWLPYNWKSSPIRYLSALLINSIAIYCILKVAYIITTLIVGSFLMLRAFVEDIKEDKKIMNQNWKENQNPDELETKLGEIIQSQVDAKQCVNYLAEIYEIILLLNFSWSVCTICVSGLVLQTEMSKDTPEITIIATYGINLLYGFILVFIYCEIGQQITNRFDTINDAICELDWDSFPFKVKKMMPTILIASQQPVELQAYGNYPCSRDTFKNVVNSAYSYFAVLNELNH